MSEPYEPVKRLTFNLPEKEVKDLLREAKAICDRWDKRQGSRKTMEFAVMVEVLLGYSEEGKVEL